jgi:hypothetical protein
MNMHAVPESFFQPPEVLPLGIATNNLAAQQAGYGQIKHAGIVGTHIPYPEGIYRQTLEWKNPNIHATSVGPLAIKYPPFFGKATKDVPVNKGISPVARVHPKVVGGPSIKNAPVAIAPGPMDYMTSLLKPAGIATAGTAGVATLLGIVWLFDQAKEFMHWKRSKKDSGKKTMKRRHIRDWTVDAE